MRAATTSVHSPMPLQFLKVGAGRISPISEAVQEIYRECSPLSLIHARLLRLPVNCSDDDPE